jgi:hypothetical protein
VRTFEREARDPFVMAMRATLDKHLATVHGAELAPNVRLAQAASRAHATQTGAPGAPDILVLVAHDRVEYAFTPRVRVSDGQARLTSIGEPVLPAMAHVKIGGTFSPFVRPIDEVVTALKVLHQRAPEARVAVGASPDLPSHVWARTFLSAQAAGFDQLAMLGVSQAGDLRSVAVEVVGPLRAAEVGPREVNVTVRLGGFSVKRAGPTVTIPRVRGDAGFAFDFDGLLESARPKEAKSAKITFMSDVAAKTLAETAFLMAEGARTLTVVLP